MIILPEPYVADTNIIIHLIRDDATGKHLKQEYNLLLLEATPVYCFVTEAEIHSLAYQWKWGGVRRDRMRFMLNYFRSISIETPEVIEAYALIDSFSKGIGVTMGKNDVWIAAVCYVHNYVLLTADRDFDHLHNVFLVRELIRKSP